MAQPHNKKLGEYPMTTRGREQGPEKRYRRLRFPAFTAAKWTAANPLLQRGELGVETDTRKFKVGDGITYWNDLEYAKASGDWGDITGDITEQTDLVEFVNNAVAAEASIRAQADQQLQSNIDNVAANLTEHEQDTNNPHNVTKAQVGLGNVDNTSDADKPVSTAQATAINNAVSTHNASETAHSNRFSQYRTSANQDTIDNQIKSDITNLQSTKADKATTLAGYGITDAYTKTEVDAKVSSVYRFRGSVATYADLPTTGQVVGDVWNVEDTGANYAWSGTEWDKLSETVDLTPYLTKTEASSKYATQSALAEVSTVAETAQQTANAAGTTAAQALAGLDSKQDKLGFATATTAGIVRVGSGSQMVVNPVTGDISLDGTKASGIRSTIGALASNQGSSNSGLILGIDGSGNVVPTESSSGGRNIGDIFLSARTNTGTAVNGAVLCNGARYNFSDINQGQNNIQALLNNGSIQSFSMAEYNAAVNSRLYVTPTFTSNSTDGHVVSDARGNSDIYTVFNGVGSKQIGNWSTYWIQEMFPTNVFINSYSITADNTTNAEYPSTWELQGSNNGSSWDSLDLQNNLEFSLGETKTFPVHLSKSYKYYRLVFIDGAQTESGNGELGRVHFNVRQSSSIGYFGYDSGASYFKVPNLMDDNATIMLSPSDFETFYHDAFFAGPQSLFLQRTVLPRALSAVILKPYVQLFNGATDDAVATCTQVLQQIANIQQTLNGMDYPIYWDADDVGDHSHSKPGVPVPVSHGWYRIYKSGWVEQGGSVGNPNNGCILVTLPIAMEGNYFTALASGNTSGVAANYNGVICERRSSTQIAICATGQQGNGCSWQVSGMAAQ